MPYKRNIILVAAALLIIVVACLGYITNKEVNDLVRDQFNKQQQLLIRQCAAGIEGFFDEKTFLIWKLGIDVSDKPTEDMPKHFIDFSRQLECFSCMGFINSSGIIATGHPYSQAGVGTNISGTDLSRLFDCAKEKGNVYIITYLPKGRDDIRSTIGMPIYSNNTFKGVIFANIEMTTISEWFLDDVVSKEDGYVYVISESGQCLYDEAHKEMIGKKYIGNFCDNNSSFAYMINEQIEKKDGSCYYFDEYTKEQQIVVYTPVECRNIDWIIGLSVPEEKIEKLVYSVYEKQILFIVVVILGIIIGCGIIVSMFSKWNKELEMEVKIKTVDLRRSNIELETANTKLKQLDRLKSEFISMVSHELRTPLTSIKLSLDVLKILPGSKKDESTRDEMLQIIDRNIDRQNRLIGDLLDISRLETGNLKLNCKAIDLLDVIEESVDSMKKAAEEKGIRIYADMQGDSFPVKADYDRLVQVLVNLINNALKFTREGEISIQAQMMNGHPQITVSDTGIGIPHDELDHIFDKFYQVDMGSRREFGGSGLGLAVCKGIIEQHGGSIRVESEVGKGSKFIILL
ncbi:MAG: sensor histidine kinase [Methanosarcinales archaeon]|nr:sensor histidine kinase [Methanosarcinales archaeon]